MEVKPTSVADAWQMVSRTVFYLKWLGETRHHRVECCACNVCSSYKLLLKAAPMLDAEATQEAEALTASN